MKRMVVIYARVSKEHEAQLSALDNQIQYYDGILKQHLDWILYDRYIDEGITGTSINKRKNFMRMMEDSREVKFNLIVTREVSRFARNIVDALQETRKLKKIGVEDDRFILKLKCSKHEDEENTLITKFIIDKDDLKDFERKSPIYKRLRMKEPIIVDICI